MTTRKTRSRLSRKVGPDHVAIGILNQFRIKKKGGTIIHHQRILQTTLELYEPKCHPIRTRNLDRKGDKCKYLRKSHNQ